MMRLFLKLASPAAVFTLVCATARPCAAQDTPSKVPVTFTATFEDLPGNVTARYKGEFVAVFDGISEDANVFRITGVEGRTWKLEGKVSEGAKSFNAVCPYEALESKSGDTLYVRIPSRQMIKTGNAVDPKACVAVASNAGTALVFRNVSSFAKFTVSGEDVAWVMLHGVVAGKTSILRNRTRLSAPQGKGVRAEPGGQFFPKGEYLIAVPPQEARGYALTCKDGDLVRWSYGEGKKTTFKKNSNTDFGTVDRGDVLLARWTFSPGSGRGLSKSFSGISEEKGGVGKVVPSNFYGKGYLDFYQKDVEGRSGIYAKRKINDKGHPEALYIWKGDFWRFRVLDANLPEGTTLHIHFKTRVSGRGMKHWRLEAFDGKEWINPESGYGKASEALGETYSFANTPEGETVECKWTLKKKCKDIVFRMVCASNWAYKADEKGPGIITEPISASCSISDAFIEIVGEE